MKGPTEPTPGFLFLTREQAQANLDARAEDLKARIRELPTPEKLRLAADMLETAGIDPSMPRAVVRLVSAELEERG